MDKARKEGRPGQLAHGTRAESRTDFECVYMSIHICRAVGQLGIIMWYEVGQRRLDYDHGWGAK